MANGSVTGVQYGPPVTDPDLIARLEAKAQQAPKVQYGPPVTDPALIARLEAGAKTGGSAVQAGEYDFWRDIGGAATHGVASALGFPADILNMGLRAVGVDTPDWMRGTENVEAGLAALGFPSQRSKTFPGQVMQSLTGAAVPLAGFMGPAVSTAGRAASTVGRLKPAIQKPHFTLMETLRNSPRASAGLELGTAGFAGAGAFAGSELTGGNPWGEALGGLALGMFNPITTGSRIGSTLAGPVRQIGRSFTRKGRERSAAEKVQSAMLARGEDPERVAGRIQDIDGPALSPTQQSDSAFLQELERARINENPDMAREYREYLARLREQTGRDIGDTAPGSPEAAVTTFARTQDEAEAGMRKLVEDAQATAGETVRATSPTLGRSQANLVEREQVEQALSRARAKEKEAWEEVDLRQTANIDPLQEVYSTLRRNATKFEAPLPDFVKRAFGDGEGSFSDMDSLANVKSFRTAVQDEISTLRAAKTGRDVIRRLGLLEDAALEVMSSRGGPAMENARATSLALNRNFRQGEVGKLLGFRPDRGPAVQPEITLETAIGQSTGPRASSAIDQLQNAADTPEADQALRDYMRHRYAQAAVDPLTREADPRSSAKFLENNRDALARLPGLEQEFRQAGVAQRYAKEANQTADQNIKALRDPRINAAEAYLRAPVGERVDSALRAQDPGRAMDELISMARVDPTGAAMDGLRSQAIREVLTGSSSATMASRGEEFLDALKLSKNFNRARPALNKLLGEEGVQRLNTFRRRLIDAEAQLASGAKLEDLINLEADGLTNLVARVAGANLGASSALAKTSGASLVMAGYGSRLMRKIMEKIPMSRTIDVIDEALKDPALMRTLLTKPTSAKKAREISARLAAFVPGTLPGTIEPTQATGPAPVDEWAWVAP